MTLILVHSFQWALDTWHFERLLGNSDQLSGWFLLEALEFAIYEHKVSFQIITGCLRHLSVWGSLADWLTFFQVLLNFAVPVLLEHANG